ncbi:MAG: phosphoribosylanthranilate isomerase [Acidobacteriaceae bacterium]|nr:phosphoribosylanthranilate isomerase [Acidobacteriaceae bacterium]
MWIKICANTTLEDAQLAANLGADAVGFVFAPSPRRVTAEQAARITPHLPGSIERVGVFLGHSEDEIVQTVEQVGLTAVQLHGGYADAASLPERLRSRLGAGVRLIQAIHWVMEPGRNTAAAVSEQLHGIAEVGIIDCVLVDSRVGAVPGGTGVSFDWEAARKVFSADYGKLKLIVAGGLRPENVAEAIRTLSPWGIDAASGVEAAPGRKSPEKLSAFLRNARQV